MSAEILDNLRLAIQPFVGEEHPSITEAIYEDMPRSERMAWIAEMDTHRKDVERLRAAFKALEASCRERHPPMPPL